MVHGELCVPGTVSVCPLSMITCAKADEALSNATRETPHSAARDSDLFNNTVFFSTFTRKIDVALDVDETRGPTPKHLPKTGNPFATLKCLILQALISRVK